ncbi:MAG TPA: ornithine cyclodeaminase family protein [Chloroflexia bacterium]|nr:ornithine cyclodeaminase family protein [Chloroflexia bacterium]
MLVLSKADIMKALDWKEAVRAVGAGFAALSSGQAEVPLRTFFPVPGQEGVMLLMPGAVRPGSDDNGQLAIKLVGIFNRNPARGLPLIYGLVTLFEADTGRPLAVFDGSTVTAVRTGAASGVATELLAAKEARVLTLFGSGAQAEMQLLAICAVLEDSIQEVRVVGRDSSRTAAFAERMARASGRRVVAVADAAEALTGAEVIATATSSFEPVFADSMLAPGAHINGIGSYQHTMREVPGETVRRCRLVVDAREAALTEAGDVLIPLKEGLIDESHIYAELGEIVAGLKPGRAAFQEGEISFFKSVGNAVQDVALAHYLYYKARELGLGTEVPL